MKYSKVNKKTRRRCDIIREFVLKDEPKIHSHQVDEILSELREEHAKYSKMVGALSFLKKLGVKEIQSLNYNSDSIKVKPSAFAKMINEDCPVFHDEHEFRADISGITLRAPAIPSLIEELNKRNSFRFKYSRNVVNNVEDFLDELSEQKTKRVKHHVKKKDFSSWTKFFSPELAKDLAFFEDQKISGKRMKELLPRKVEAHFHEKLPDWF